MAYSYQHPHPAVTTDVVIFTIQGDRLEVLLVRRGTEPYRGSWALPGGFLDSDEDLKACAKRELEEETGVTGVYLEQLYTFGAPDRDPRKRVISVAYYALVPPDRLQLRAASDAEAVAWYSLDALPPLAFDHKDIIAMAHKRLSSKLDYSTIALQFMPEKFTLSALQKVYEIILGERLDKRNFRKRVITFACIQHTGELAQYGKHRPARLYTVISPGTVEFIK
ncbi:MAG: NUDIX hydrolase [Gammaproteobacteria bacterium]|nr:NUDIX hydrolase [Gammaproteobacteria bacterium]MCI0590778.1 NUDIX hydrolase [Gammaproteobacteria bacterium]